MKSCRHGLGRPSFKIDIDFKNLQKSINQRKGMCSNDDIKENIRLLARDVLMITDDVLDRSTQTSDEMFYKNIQFKSEEEQPFIYLHF